MSTVKLDAVFTHAGINRLLSMKDKGLKEALTHIAIGDVAFKPNNSMTMLLNERERFPITDVQNGDLSARIGVRASSENEFPVRSVAGFLEDGTMLFAYSSADLNFLLTYLTPHISGLDIRFLLKLDAVPSNALTFTVTDPGSLIYTKQFAQMATMQISNSRRFIEQMINKK